MWVRFDIQRPVNPPIVLACGCEILIGAQKYVTPPFSNRVPPTLNQSEEHIEKRNSEILRWQKIDEIVSINCNAAIYTAFLILFKSYYLLLKNIITDIIIICYLLDWYKYKWNSPAFIICHCKLNIFGTVGQIKQSIWRRHLRL